MATFHIYDRQGFQGSHRSLARAGRIARELARQRRAQGLTLTAADVRVVQCLPGYSTDGSEAVVFRPGYRVELDGVAIVTLTYNEARVARGSRTAKIERLR